MYFYESGEKMKRDNTTTLKLLVEAIIVGIFTGLVVGLFRFGIEKTSAFWLDLFKKAHQNLSLYSGTLASGSLMTFTCKSLASIKTSCLHFGQ